MPTLIEKDAIEIPHGTSKTEADRIRSLVAKDYVIERIKRKINPSQYELNKNIKHWSDHIFILEAGTGSGKSVSIPPEVYINFKDQVGRNVVTTQPRQVSAIKTVQDDIIKWYPLTLGVDVGYQTGAIAKRPIKGLIFVTIGVLLQQMKIMSQEQFMKKYSVIILDEAHERSMDMDLTMYFLKSLLQEHWENPLCPTVILMSATLEIDRFTRYFGEKKNIPEIIRVRGKTYEVEPHFLDTPTGNYIWKIIDTIKMLHANEDDFNETIRDILVFVSGGAEIKKLLEELVKINETLEHKIYPMQFAGGGKGARAADGTELPDISVLIETLTVDNVTPKRKVIITTNAAETSLTVDTLKYVIDSGFRNAVEFDPSGFTTFIVKPVTQDSAKQRRGRVGRVAPGHWYPMYTEKDFNSFQEAKFPDIITTDISPSILSLIVKDGHFDLDHLDLMDKPPGDSLHYALEKLYALGAIDVRNKQIVPTNTGILINKFRKISLENIKMILAGYHYGANVLDLITIAALSSTVGITGRKYKPREVFSSHNRQVYLIADTFIDLIFLFEEFRNIIPKGMKSVLKWCDDNSVSYKEMLGAIAARDSLIEDIILVAGFDPLYNGIGEPAIEYSLRHMLKTVPDIGVEEVVKIKKCILEGYRLNLSRRTENNYRNLSGGFSLNAQIEGNPQYIVYSNVMLRSGKPIDGAASYERSIAGYYSVMDNFVLIDETFL